MDEIKVGFCVAYDWHLLQYSLPLIYKQADKICLSLDMDRISWSGNRFSWDEKGFREMVNKIDIDRKIKVLEEDYYLPELQPMQNEVRQRNKIAEFLGEGGWHIQLDTDEFFLNFKSFVDYLHRLKPQRKINVVCPWITLYKQDLGGFYYIKSEKFEQVEFIQIATKWPHYEYGRRNGYFNIHTDFAILHLSWARSEAEIWEKLNNWGHKNDFDIKEYFERWKDLNNSNYFTYKNLHHVKAEAWPGLDFLPAKSLDELLTSSYAEIELPISSNQLKMKNSVWVSRFRALFSNQ